MSRPLLEMADIVRCAGQAFIERSHRWINWQHRKVLLAIPRQPQPRHAAAAVFLAAWWIGKDHCSSSIDVCRRDSLALELSRLRRNHARRRADGRRATLASFSASTGTVRRMTVSPHPRLLHVLRRVRRPLVSSGQNCSVSSLSNLHIRHRRATALIKLALIDADRADQNLCYQSPGPISPIQNA